MAAVCADENMKSNAPANAPAQDGDDAARKLAKAKARKKAKKARQKAKKRAAAKAKLESEPEGGTCESPAAGGYVNRARRGDAGKGRGQGLFASARIAPGEVVLRARPALSTIFDAYATKVCGFCFATSTSKSRCAPTLHTLMLQKSGGKLGVFVDEKSISFADGGLGKEGTGPVTCAVLNGCGPESPNQEAGIKPGDVVQSVCGEFMTPGNGALHRCLAALAGSNTMDGEMFPVVVQRPSIEACETCRRFATCSGCRAKGLKDWHDSYECKTFKHLPEKVTKGETSPIRMMLRHRAIAERGDWASPCPLVDGSKLSSMTIQGQPPPCKACGDKEHLALVSTLQANRDVVPQSQKIALSGLTGVKPEVVSLLIGQIRGNAAGIEWNGQKVGCALSVLMGYCNHDCTPNAEASVDEEGFVKIIALRAIEETDEICISYVDRNASVLDRRAILSDHYEFECRCKRCLKEQREYLKAKARNRGKEYLMNNSKLARNAYLHDMGAVPRKGPAAATR